MVVGRVQNGNCQQHVANSHDDKTPLDGALVVLGAVCYVTADKAQYIDT